MNSTVIGMLLILGGLACHQAEAMIVKHYGNKYGKGGMFFNAILCFFAVIYFVIIDTDGFVLPQGVFLFGLVNSVMYAIGFYAGYVAYKSGSFGLTRLFMSFGVIFSIIYGIVVLKEPTSVTMYAAIALILVSIFLMRYQKTDQTEKLRFSLKWLIALIFTILSNAAIVILNKELYNAFDGNYKNEYLIVTFLGSALWLMLMGLIFERKDFKATFRHGLLHGMAAGLLNGTNNLLSLMAFGYITLSFMSPVKTGIGVLISFLISVLFYKEKFTRLQMLGVLIGIAAVILINI